MKILLEAVTLGFIYGLGPCTAYCAPLIVPLMMSTTKNAKQAFINTMVFGFGRVLSYILLGMVSGFLGVLLKNIITTKVIGIFMLLVAVAILFKVPGKCILPRFKITGLHMSFIAGIIFGFSPCAPLIAALGLAVISQSMWLGGLIGLIFGIGTLLSPILLLGFLAGKWAEKKEFKNISVYVSAGFLILFGIMYILA